MTPAAKNSNRRADALAALLLLALSLGFHWRVLGGAAAVPFDLLQKQYPWGVVYRSHAPAQNPEPMDILHAVYPWRQFLGDSLRRGEVPLWNPHALCGTPFAANDQSAVFYPPNLLFAFMPAWRAFGVLGILHLFLAGFFAYLLGRALRLNACGSFVLGMAYMFTGWLVAAPPGSARFYAMPWAPLIFACYELAARRRRVAPTVAGGIALGVAMTSGYLQMVSHTGYALAIYAAARWLFTNREKRNAAWSFAPLLLIGFIGVAVAAVHLGPVAELAAQSQRPAASLRPGTIPGIPVERLLTLVLPDIFGNPTAGDPPVDAAETFFYIGVTALLLACFAVVRRGESAARAAALVALIGLLSAFGTPVYLLFAKLIPGAAYLRPSRIIFVFSLGAAILAGFGADALTGRSELRQRASRGGPILIAAVVAVAALFAIFYAHIDARHFISNSSGVHQLAAFIATVLIATAVFRFSPRMKPIATAAVLFGMIFFDLFLWGLPFNPASDSKLAFPATPSISWLRKQPGFFRIHSRSWGMGMLLFPNTPTVYGFQDIRGYDALYPRRTWDFLRTVQESNGDAAFAAGNVSNLSVVESPWLDLLNVKYLLSLRPVQSDRWRRPANLTNTEVFVYRNRTAFPRAFVASDWTTQPADPVASALISTPGFNPTKTFIASCAKPRGVPHRNRIAPANILKYSTGKVTLRANGPGLLVLTDIWYPGWTATVDGKRQEICRVDSALRGVVLTGRGPRNVSFCFQPRSANIGLAISLAALAAAAVGLIISAKRGGENIA